MELEHELGVGEVDEVHAAEGAAVGAVGGIQIEEVCLVHEHRVLNVGGLGVGGEGGDVAALVVLRVDGGGGEGHGRHACLVGWIWSVSGLLL